MTPPPAKHQRAREKATDRRVLTPGQRDMIREVLSEAQAHYEKSVGMSMEEHRLAHKELALLLPRLVQIANWAEREMHSQVADQTKTESRKERVVEKFIDMFVPFLLFALLYGGAKLLGIQLTLHGAG